MLALSWASPHPAEEVRNAPLQWSWSDPQNFDSVLEFRWHSKNHRCCSWTSWNTQSGSALVHWVFPRESDFDLTILRSNSVASVGGRRGKLTAATLLRPIDIDVTVGSEIILLLSASLLSTRVRRERIIRTDTSHLNVLISRDIVLTHLWAGQRRGRDTHGFCHRIQMKWQRGTEAQQTICWISFMITHRGKKTELDLILVPFIEIRSKHCRSWRLHNALFHRRVLLFFHFNHTERFTKQRNILIARKVLSLYYDSKRNATRSAFIHVDALQLPRWLDPCVLFHSQSVGMLLITVRATLKWSPVSNNWSIREEGRERIIHFLWQWMCQQSRSCARFT